MTVRIVKHVFEIIHLLTDKNPLQGYVDAVKNGGLREDSTHVGSAGVVRRQAVDVSPLGIGRVKGLLAFSVRVADCNQWGGRES